MNAQVLVLDNRDSFVFNLVDDLARLGLRPRVVRSDAPPAEVEAQLECTRPMLALLSPGPGHPAEHAALLPFLEVCRARPNQPVLGVCLGLQAMVCASGGRIGASPQGPVHGRATRVVHAGDPLFDGIPSGFLAARYHSLAAAELTGELEPIAWSEDRSTVMALRHRSLPWLGLQFHPESVLTPDGRRLISNFVRTLR